MMTFKLKDISFGSRLDGRRLHRKWFPQHFSCSSYAQLNVDFQVHQFCLTKRKRENIITLQFLVRKNKSLWDTNSFTLVPGNEIPSSCFLLQKWNLYFALFKSCHNRLNPVTKRNSIQVAMTEVLTKLLFLNIVYWSFNWTSSVTTYWFVGHGAMKLNPGFLSSETREGVTISSLFIPWLKRRYSWLSQCLSKGILKGWKGVRLSF